VIRAVSIFLLLLGIGCSGTVPVVAKGQITVPSGTHYCVDMQYGKNRTPVVICTPDRKLCEWGSEQGRGFIGKRAGVTKLTKCYPKPVYGAR
jgi:hypothetical protein